MLFTAPGRVRGVKRGQGVLPWVFPTDGMNRIDSLTTGLGGPNLPLPCRGLEGDLPFQRLVRVVPPGSPHSPLRPAQLPPAPSSLMKGFQEGLQEVSTVVDPESFGPLVVSKARGVAESRNRKGIQKGTNTSSPGQPREVK